MEELSEAPCRRMLRKKKTNVIQILINKYLVYIMLFNR